MNNPKFTLFRGSNYQYYFNLKARNGERILNSEAYITKQGALAGINSVKANAPFDIRYNRKNSVDGKYYFTLHASNGETIGVSETYNSIQGRENGIAAVKSDAPTAPVEDLT